MSMSSRIERVIQDLCAIQEDLNRLLIDDATRAPGGVPLSAHIDELRDLKSVVDQMRHFLWFYIQVVSENSVASERTLQLLRQVSKTPDALRPDSPLSFLERLNALSEYALVHYHEDGNNKPN